MIIKDFLSRGTNEWFPSNKEVEDPFPYNIRKKLLVAVWVQLKKKKQSTTPQLSNCFRKLLFKMLTRRDKWKVRTEKKYSFKIINWYISYNQSNNKNFVIFKQKVSKRDGKLYL